MGPETCAAHGLVEGSHREIKDTCAELNKTVASLESWVRGIYEKNKERDLEVQDHIRDSVAFRQTVITHTAQLAALDKVIEWAKYIFTSIILGLFATGAAWGVIIEKTTRIERQMDQNIQARMTRDLP